MSHIPQNASESKRAIFFNMEGWKTTPLSQCLSDNGWQVSGLKEEYQRSVQVSPSTLLIFREEDLIMPKEFVETLINKNGEEPRILVLHPSKDTSNGYSYTRIDKLFPSAHHVTLPIQEDELKEILREVDGMRISHSENWIHVPDFDEEYRLTTLEHHEAPCSPKLFNYLRRQGIDESNFLLLKLELVFQEAIANAFEHGNLELRSEWRELIRSDGIDYFSRRKIERLSSRRYSKREIFASLSLKKGKLTIAIEDQGPGFDVDAKMIPDADGVVRCYGRGLSLMNLVMDTVTFSKGGRRVELTKDLSSGE